MAITTIKEAYENIWEFRGLSTDKKPTNTTNSSIFLEMDTGSLFIFDAEHKEWKPLGEGGSSPTPGGNYTAGPGLVLTGTEFSIDEQIVAKKQEIAVELLKKQDALAAGEGIEIAPNPSTGKLTIKSTGGGNISKGSGDKSLLQATRADSFTNPIDGQTYDVDAQGQASVVLGGKGYVAPAAKYSTVLGTGNVAKSGCCLMAGDNCLAEPNEAGTSESFNALVSGYANHVVGSSYSVVTGQSNTLTDGVIGFVTGSNNEVSGHNVFVEGHENFNGDLSGDLIEGTHGEGSHVAGIGNKNDSFYSFVSGARNENICGDYSFVTGLENKVDDSDYSFVAGMRNTSHGATGQAVFGQYNNNRSEDLFEIGCGENEYSRKNIFRATKDGKVYFYNDNSYIDTTGYFSGTCRAASSANYASSAGSAATATRADSAQDSFHSDTVTVNPDGSYIGAILVNSDSNPNTIVRKDTVKVTGEGKVIAGAHTTDSDSGTILATKSYVDSKASGGKTYYEGYGITIDSSNYININTNIAATRDWVNYWMGEYYTSKSSFNDLQDRVTSAEGNISTVSSKVNAIENGIYDHSRTISGTFNTYAEIAAEAAARTLTTGAYYAVLFDETHDNEASIYVYVMHAAMYDGPYSKIVTEAPNDYNKKYARQGGTRSWVEIPTYTAGEHINISTDNVISVNTDTLATKSYVDTKARQEAAIVDTRRYNFVSSTELVKYENSDVKMHHYSDLATYPGRDGMTAVVTEDENRSYWPTLYTYNGDTNTWVFTKNSFKERNFYLKDELYTKTEVDNELSGKLGKYYGQGADVLYGVNTDGTQEMYSVTTHAAAFTIARRDASGNITVGTPYTDNDAASKAYVDAAVDSKLKYIAENLDQSQIEVLVAFVQNLTKSEE